MTDFVTRTEPPRKPVAVCVAHLEDMFSINIEAIDGAAVCRIHGEADSASASELREAMSRLSTFPRVVLDFSGVPFIDSAGLGAVIGGTRRIREVGGAITLCSARRAIHRLLYTVGMDRILPIFDTLPEALQFFEDSDATAEAMA